jgi:hypothetical protein
MKVFIIFVMLFLLFSCGNNPSNNFSNKTKLTTTMINDSTCSECASVYFEKTYLMLQFNQLVDNCSGVFNITLNEDFVLPTEGQLINYSLYEPLNSATCNIGTSLIYIKKENDVYNLYIGAYKFTLKESTI